ncbi:cell wall-binding repeat-containing protein [Clostridium sp.]|jgi:putative cell wall-binding protein|uniref:cell wall-binding repeat-containing protein n=1 Tax=Clostridium sp. TaxID=1506 RepID=UPI003EEE242A
MLKGKRLFLGTLIGIFLCGGLNFTPVFAENADITNTRLSGANRYTTSADISKAGWMQSNTVIIANGLGYADALAASSLSKSKDAPILLTSKNAINASVITEIKRLEATDAILVGGTGVIANGVENQLKNLGINFTRIGGTDRYDTSKMVAEAMGVDSGIIVATGLDFPDALSIAPIAGIKSMPILLSPKETMNPNIEKFIKSKDIPVSYIVGQTDVIGSSIASNLPNSKRLGGNNRYATNLVINKNFEDDLNFETIYLATGSNFPDALAGSALAAKNNSPIFLTGRNSLSEETINVLKNKKVKNVVVLGGSDVVSDNIVNDTIKSITASNETGYVYNKGLDTDLNVRSAPNLNSNVVGHLYNNEKIEILETVYDTSTNVSQWYKIVYKTGIAYVAKIYIQVYTSPPDTVVEIAKNISKQYEVGNSTQVVGNYDEQGLSIGYLQWNIGQATLQHLLNRMDRQYNDEMKTIFGTNYDAIHEMIMDKKLENQLEWAKSINDSNDEIIESWKSQFEVLCKNENFKGIEADAEVYFVKQAMFISENYNIETVRGFALAFDIVLQNGGIGTEAIKIIDSAKAQTPNMTEKDLLKVIANAVADTSDGLEDVISRKMTIIYGEGMVHGITLDLDTNYKLSDKYWR